MNYFFSILKSLRSLKWVMQREKTARWSILYKKLNCYSKILSFEVTDVLQDVVTVTDSSFWYLDRSKIRSWSDIIFDPRKKIIQIIRRQDRPHFEGPSVFLSSSTSKTGRAPSGVLGYDFSLQKKMFRHNTTDPNDQ